LGDEGPRLRILLTNHHLESLAGSELLTFELAKECQQRGHHVSVFTLFPGQISRRIEELLGIRVFDTRNKEDLKTLDFDVMHCIHWPTYLYLQRSGIELPTVFGFLGVLPALENPPPLPGKQKPFWWGVSEEVIENVANLPGWENRKPIEPIRNWVNEYKPKVMPIEAIRKQVFGVVSNHFPEKYKEYLVELSLEMNFELRFMGLPDNSQPIDLETLLDFDALITLGRTAVTAICNGIPVLVLDQNGMDGWVTPENYFHLRVKNFSGRTKAEVPTKEKLRLAILDKPDQKTTIKLTELATPEHNLPSRVGQILGLCELARDSKSTTTFPKAEQVALEYLDRSFHFESLRDSLLSERQSLLSERQSLLSERQSLLSERQSILSEKQSLLSEIEAIRNSNSWKVTQAARTISGLFRKILSHKG
jgi:hypothetical protein